jgi:hypothetical protein
MTDEAYLTLKERVRKGKAMLEGKWSSPDPEIQEWATLWRDLADKLFKEECIRGVYKVMPGHDELLASAEAKIEAGRLALKEAKKKGGK